MTEAEKKLRKQYSKERKRVQKIIKRSGASVSLPKLKDMTTSEIKIGLKQLKKIHNKEQIFNFTNLEYNVDSPTKPSKKTNKKSQNKKSDKKPKDKNRDMYEDEDEDEDYPFTDDIPTFDPLVNQTDLFLDFFDSSDKNLKKPADGGDIMLSFYEDMYNAFLNDPTYADLSDEEKENAFKKKFGMWLELVFGGAGRYGYGEFYSDVWARRYIEQFIPYMGDYYRSAFEKINEENDHFYDSDTDL